jgi:hypothetical protein
MLPRVNTVFTPTIRFYLAQYGKFPPGLIGKEIENIPQGGCRSLVELSITAAGTGQGGEFFILNIKNL